jgi:hypothetical protein
MESWCEANKEVAVQRFGNMAWSAALRGRQARQDGGDRRCDGVVHTARGCHVPQVVAGDLHGEE